SESCRFKVFVGTCVMEIQELMAESTWHYVDSAQNPADDVTCGKTLADLALLNRWSQGPSFLLKGSAEWPSPPGANPEQDTIEYKKTASYGVMSRADRQEAHAGHGAPADLTVGSVILLMDPQVLQALWPIGRGVKVNPSVDGHVRSVDVQIKDKVYTLPVARLIALPVIPDAEDEICPSTSPD
ncbi:hypothetical protein M9458_030202, partial [Cirrhinus mrigala]